MVMGEDELRGIFSRAGMKFDPTLWPANCLGTGADGRPTPSDLRQRAAERRWATENGDRSIPHVERIRGGLISDDDALKRLRPAPASVYLLAEHLDAALAAGEDLIGVLYVWSGTPPREDATSSSTSAPAGARPSRRSAPSSLRCSRACSWAASGR